MRDYQFYQCPKSLKSTLVYKITLIKHALLKKFKTSHVHLWCDYARGKRWLNSIKACKTESTADNIKYSF